MHQNNITTTIFVYTIASQFISLCYSCLIEQASIAKAEPIKA